MQTWIGCYMHTSGVKEHVIDFLRDYGISVGQKSIDEIVKALADHQKEKLKQIGANMVNDPFNMVYDNINIHEKIGQQRGEHQDKQFNGICGFVMPMPGGPTLLRRDAIQPQKLEGITSRIFLENKDLATYSKILQRRQIEITIQQTLLDPVLKLKSKTGKPWIDQSIRWRFDRRETDKLLDLVKPTKPPRPTEITEATRFNYTIDLEEYKEEKAVWVRADDNLGKMRRTIC